jgi:hypothetical protein
MGGTIFDDTLIKIKNDYQNMYSTAEIEWLKIYIAPHRIHYRLQIKFKDAADEAEFILRESV